MLFKLFIQAVSQAGLRYARGVNMTYFLIIGVICLLLAGAYFCRRYIAKTYDRIDSILERAVRKDAGLFLDTVEESRLSKLAHKAAHILDLYQMETGEVKKEKETIQSFISDMSHQMKTPLSSISMYTDLLLLGNLPKAEQEDFLNRIKSNADKLEWMMESLIKMSRLEIGAIQLSPEALGIKQTISNAIGSVLQAADRKNIQIITEEFEDIVIWHDKKWTAEVLINILENAVKYADTDSIIQIISEKLPLHTKITILNDGIGIAKEELHLIFKRFYRGKNVKDKEGTGLGLYLASLIMEKQGGYILADSVSGSSASFSLFLQNCQN